MLTKHVLSKSTLRGKKLYLYCRSQRALCVPIADGHTELYLVCRKNWKADSELSPRHCFVLQSACTAANTDVPWDSQGTHTGSSRSLRSYVLPFSHQKGAHSVDNVYKNGDWVALSCWWSTLDSAEQPESRRVFSRPEASAGWGGAQWSLRHLQQTWCWKDRGIGDHYRLLFLLKPHECGQKDNLLWWSWFYCQSHTSIQNYQATSYIPLLLGRAPSHTTISQSLLKLKEKRQWSQQCYNENNKLYLKGTTLFRNVV